MLLSSGCWFSPGPHRLVFSAGPRCRWLPASELSALLTRARKSALTASGHCVKNGNRLRRSRRLSSPRGDQVAISPPLPPNLALLMDMGRGPEHSQLPQDLRGSACPIATGKGRVVLWCSAASVPAAPSPASPRGSLGAWLLRCWRRQRWHQQGLRRGVVLPWVCLEGNGAGGWRAGCGGAALQAATGSAGEAQDRNDQETFIFYCCFVFGMEGACSFL